VSAHRLDPQFLREAHEFGYGLHAELTHDAGSVGFNRALGRAQIKGDLFVQLTADDMSQHLSFARGEVFITIE
jgi:hypothetical protein